MFYWVSTNGKATIRVASDGFSIMQMLGYHLGLGSETIKEEYWYYWNVPITDIAALLELLKEEGVAHRVNEIPTGDLTLKLAEGMWVLKGPDCLDMYLGEAGNPRRRDSLSAIRIGDIVTVTRENGRISVQIPATAKLKGFYPDELNGKTMAEVMQEGVEYNYALGAIG